MRFDFEVDGYLVLSLDHEQLLNLLAFRGASGVVLQPGAELRVLARSGADRLRETHRVPFPEDDDQE